jgi:Flp pilus assembly protein TadD
MDFLARQGRSQDVIQVGAEFLAAQGEQPAVLNALAVHALQGRKVTEAKGYLQRCLAASPHDAAGLALRARIALAEGDLATAGSAIDTALAAHPEHVPMLFLRALLLQRNGDGEGVRRTYERILGLDPNNVVAANNLAQLYLEQENQLGEALRLARLAAEGAPANPVMQDTLGWVYFKMSSYEQAREALTIAHAGLKGNPEVAYHLGMTHAKLGEKQKARELLSEALAAEKKGDWAFDAGQTLQELQ